MSARGAMSQAAAAAGEVKRNSATVEVGATEPCKRTGLNQHGCRTKYMFQVVSPHSKAMLGLEFLGFEGRCFRGWGERLVSLDSCFCWIAA